MKHAITVDLDIDNLLLSLDESQNKTYYYYFGKEILATQKQIVDESLERYKDEYGIFDANLIEKDWFPQIDADIFISHSHKDEESVLIFAGLINCFFNKTCFIDSCCWNYCDDLTSDLKDFYYLNGDSDAASYAQSHVHIMLSVALSKMISNTECLMFFRTPSSISLTDGIEDYTFSPWIYSELQTANIILDAYKKSASLDEQIRNERHFSIKYQTEMSRFLKMNLEAACKWFSNEYPKGKALNYLYTQLTPGRHIIRG